MSLTTALKDRQRGSKEMVNSSTFFFSRFRHRFKPEQIMQVFIFSLSKQEQVSLKRFTTLEHQKFYFSVPKAEGSYGTKGPPSKR